MLRFHFTAAINQACVSNRFIIGTGRNLREIKVIEDSVK